MYILSIKNETKLFFLFLFLTSFSFGQTRYVTAEHGLIIRKFPNIKSKRIGKLDYGTNLSITKKRPYGTSISITKKTSHRFSVTDNGKKINGYWVKIRFRMQKGYVKGYVFNGFLTKYISKIRYKVKFKEFTVISPLNLDVPSGEYDQKATFYVGHGNYPQGKKFTIKLNKGYKNVRVYQQYENSINITNEGPHCGLTEWKHYYSPWEKLNYNSKQNSFICKDYEESDENKFVTIDINKLKKVVRKKCGKFWANIIKDIKNVPDNHCVVSISRIFLKLELTNDKNKTITKIICFELAMGCH